MARLAVINEGVVVNIILAEEDFKIKGSVLVPLTDLQQPRIGDRYKKGQFERQEDTV